MGEIIIRPYAGKDRDAVRQIAFDTAFLGEPGSAFFDSREMLADFLTDYFIDYEPQSCFVAESGGEVIGYLLGAKDSACPRPGLAGKLLLKAVKQNIIFNRKNAAFIFRCLTSFFRGEFKAPDFSREYPATLHINIKDGFRSQGIGAKLIGVYLDYLKKEKIKGVHFATLSERAANFYERLGFTLLHKAKRSYFNSILHKDVFCYIYGKRYEDN
ncbi:MAG: GNAT family N-acetyltransferase [Candidatus Omnitrophota bacterium]